MFNILKKFLEFSGPENEKKFKRALLLETIIAFANALKVSAIMYILMGIIEKSNINEHILGSLIIMLISILISFICRKKSTMLQTEGGYKSSADKRVDIAEHLRYLPMGYFNDNSLGHITSVATNTMESLGDIATRVVMITSKGILESILIIIMILIFDYRIGLIAAGGALIFFLVNKKMQNSGKEISEIKVNNDQNLVAEVMEYIQGISEVKSYNLFSNHIESLNKANRECTITNIRMEKAYIPYHLIQALVLRITSFAIVAFSIKFYLESSMTLIYAIGMTIASFMIFSGLEAAGSFSSLLHTMSVSIDKAKEILDLDTMDIDGKEIDVKNHNIEVKNISFSYDKRKIIDNVSLSIPENTTTAIVGPSGGGKTSLCNLIARFWDVDSGTITLGGEDVKSYSMNSLMKNFSFVFQNVYLFADTIENNVKFSNPNASHEEVVKACKKASCHDFISKLPKGYQTIIGEGGASLSGGEKQRISIARAIMKDAPIIILDEATANVDPENERELTQAIEALTREKTIIMIAHRLKTIRNADKIVVIDKGRIVQEGNHNQLIKEEGIYKRFVDSRQEAVSWKL